MALTLYSFEGDFRAFKAAIAAEYNGITLARKNVDLAAGEQKTPAFLAKSPLGKVPVLETDSGSVFESNAIARYIARLRRDTELYGATFFESGQVDSWLDFASNDVELPASLWLYPVFGYTEFKPEVYTQAVQGLKAALTILENTLISKTFLVGNKITLADIVLVSALFYPFKFLLDADFRAPFPSVTRWFFTAVNQPQFQNVVGAFTFAAEELKAAGATGSASAVAAAGGAGKGKAVKGEAKPKAEAAPAAPKAEKPKKEKAAAAPKPAPAPAPAAPEEPAGGAGYDDDEEEKPKIKVKGPFDDLAPSKMHLDTWKKTYSNSKTDFYLAMKPFWAEQFDAEGYSIWFCKYKYNEENTVDYKTSNLVGGFLQRCDDIRRYAFGTMVILNETAPFDVEGCWLIRGQSIAPLLEANPDAEYYEWTKADTTDEKTKALIADYWCSFGNINGKAQLDSKVFK